MRQILTRFTNSREYIYYRMGTAKILILIFAAGAYLQSLNGRFHKKARGLF